MSSSPDFVVERLFKDHIYYCEGRERTWIRGWPHFIGATIILPACYYFVFRNNDNYLYRISAILFIIGTQICWLTSFLYHTIDHKCLRDEIAFQKLDHAAIFLKTTSCWASIYLLSLYPNYPTVFWTALSTLIIGLSANWITLFFFNHTDPIYIGIFTATILLFWNWIRNHLCNYSFLVLAVLLAIQFTVFMKHIDTYYIHYHDLFHIINVISISVFFIGIFSRLNNQK